MFTRRSVLLAAGAATLAGGPRRATGDTGQTLRMGYIFSAQSHLGAGAAVFAKEVERRTAGRIRIQQFPDGALGGDVELAKAVALGTVDLAFINGAGLPTIAPELDIVHIPFLFSDVSHARAAMDGAIGEEFAQALAAKGLVTLAWGENGLRHITNSKKPIATPADLQGLKMRVPQSEVMQIVFQALGAEASLLPFPQLFDALQSGRFDGEENPIAVIQSSRFDQVQRFLSITGHVYDPAVIAMSPDAFADLSAADKTAVTEAARLGAKASRDAAARAEIAGLIALKQAGMQVLETIDRPLFARAVASANPAFETRFGRGRIERIRAAA